MIYRTVKESCSGSGANESGPLPSFLRNVRGSAIELEPPRLDFGGEAPCGDGSANEPASDLQRHDAQVGCGIRSTRPDAALRELPAIGPPTVVWLNGAQFYLDVTAGGLGERVASIGPSSQPSAFLAREGMQGAPQHRKLSLRRSIVLASFDLRFLGGGPET